MKKLSFIERIKKAITKELNEKNNKLDPDILFVEGDLVVKHAPEEEGEY